MAEQRATCRQRSLHVAKVLKYLTALATAPCSSLPTYEN